ncbi:unnamed protein product [Staurois parvus]|uniref:Uncharacterized protein n=1 Tax=Staurois parvus TaxID=386267 RepID=A0ABN9GI04_9NEOB|nr:unnamed protein product [Staurois parvus]
METRLTTEEERDNAKPQNLHCNDTDANFTCSWHVREEISESIDFDLYYNEKACQPKCLQDALKYLTCHCNIMTDGDVNTSAYISVKPRKPEKSISSVKSFRLCLIYQLPPRNLTINETKRGEAFTATWKDTTPEHRDFHYLYELCYWNQSDLKQIEVPNNCPVEPEEIKSNQDPSKIFQLGKQLKPSSNYSVMVRVRLNEENKKHCFQGPWSEWSKIQTLTTKAVPSLIVLYIMIPICVIIFVLFAVCGYSALVRYTKQWDESIPNPNKSTIIKGLQKTKNRLVMHHVTFQNGSCLPYEEHLYVEPCNNIMM